MTIQLRYFVRASIGPLAVLFIFLRVEPAVIAQDASSVRRVELRSLVETAEPKINSLRQKLQRCRSDGQDVSVPDAELAVAELFHQYAVHDEKTAERHQSAVRSMKYVDSMLDSALQEADGVLSGTSNYPRIPKWNVVGLKVRDGGFWSGDDPVFLTGFNWNASWAASDPKLMKRLGVNLVDGMLRGGLKRSGEVEDDWYRNRSQRFLDQMERDNFAVDLMLSISPPDWLYAKHPDLKSPGYGHYTHYAFDHPAYVDYRRDVLDRLVPLYAKHKAVLAIDLMNEPAYQGTSTHTFDLWRAWLRNKYGSIEAVNDAWGTDFGNFDAIDSFPTQPDERKNEWQRKRVDWNKPGARGMHFDWCAFNKHRVTQYFGDANERIRLHAPHVSTHVKAMLSNYFTGSTEQRGWPMQTSYNTFGIDVEAINRMCGINGGDDSFRDLSATAMPNRYFGNSAYVAGWLNSGMVTDLLKSISPNQPFYNSEFHAVEEVDSEENEPIPAEHMKLALWHSHLHGMHANLLWYLGRQPNGEINDQGKRWFDDSLLDQPWLLHAYATESLKLRRFVPEVSAFARQPREVRILYSEASAIQDVHAIDTLRDTYEALNFLGVHVGFVTERQLATDWLSSRDGKQTRLVIVPNATYVADQTLHRLQDAAKAGILIRIIGDESLLRTPVGKRRQEITIPGSKTISLGTPQEYHRQLNKWLHEAEVERDLIAVDAQGHPVWGIEVRTARSGENRFAYLINLMCAPVTVKLQWAASETKFHDLNAGQALSDSITLQPRETVIGDY